MSQENVLRKEEYAPAPAEEYDSQWEVLNDFIKYNPGARHRRRGILKLLKKARFYNMLDVGCGNGELINDIKSFYGYAISYKGVDLSPEVVAKNNKRCPFASFSALNIEEEALDEKFDLVTCSEVIEHLGDRKKAFKHLSSMLNLSLIHI